MHTHQQIHHQQAHLSLIKLKTSTPAILLLFVALLTLASTTQYQWQTLVITSLLLFLPLTDKNWFFPKPTMYQYQWQLYALLISALIFLSLHYLSVNSYSATLHLFVMAISEEWFFRAYFMQKMTTALHDLNIKFGQPKFSAIQPLHAANLGTSMVFALLHTPTQGWFGLTVLFPSLFFGWLYQRHNDLLLVVLCHSLANMIFILFLRTYLFKG